MITLNYDITTGLAKLAAATPIKRYGDVPVRLVFSAAPGTVSDIKLALGSDADAPAVLAYTDTWTQESDTVWTAQLDMTDTRLATFMTGLASVAVNLELIVTIDGEAQYSPNLALTVQQPIVTGPTSSDGGPVYYTQAQTNTAIATAVATAAATAAAATTAALARRVVKRLDADAADIVSNATPAMDGVLQWAVAANEKWIFEGFFILDETDNTDAPGFNLTILATHAAAKSAFSFFDTSNGSFMTPSSAASPPNVIGDVIFLGTGPQIVVFARGSLTMGGTGGTVGLGFAQGSTSTQGVRLKAGSWLTADKA